MSAQSLVELFNLALTRADYGQALAAIGESARFSNQERGEIVRAIIRCWSRIAQL
jgi:hypothetical protein